MRYLTPPGLPEIQAWRTSHYLKVTVSRCLDSRCLPSISRNSSTPFTNPHLHPGQFRVVIILWLDQLGGIAGNRRCHLKKVGAKDQAKLQDHLRWLNCTMAFFPERNTPKPLQTHLSARRWRKKKKTPSPSQKKDHESDISEIDISTSKLFGKGQSFNFGSELKTRAQGRTRIYRRYNWTHKTSTGINLHGMAELGAQNIQNGVNETKSQEEASLRKNLYLSHALLGKARLLGRSSPVLLVLGVALLHSPILS